MLFIRAFILFCLSVVLIEAVDRSKFRTCHDTGFCRNYRQENTFSTVFDQQRFYHVQKSSIHEGEVFSANLVSAKSTQPLNLELSFLKTGNIRFRVTETTKRWQPDDLLLASGLERVSYSKVNKEKVPGPWKSQDPGTFAAFSFSSDEVVLVLQYSPFKLELYRDNILVISVNDRQLFHFEQTSSTQSGEKIERRQLSDADRHHGKEVVDYGEDGLAIYADGTREERGADGDDQGNSDSVSSDSDRAHGESFGGHFDSMPYGPRSVGIDISFPAASHLYGIPEHSTPLSLPTTAIGSGNVPAKYSQPYRLYTLDVFEYELQETMALYGTIPVVYAHGIRPDGKGAITSGVFWYNPSETFVDIAEGKAAAAGRSSKETHWLSESGLVDAFLFSGPSIKEVIRQFSSLVGTQQLPPIFSLGYHQCRWNYRDERDVREVDSMFEQLNYPYDVLWLDIEHTDGKRYFTWDNRLFANPIEMQKNLSSHGRRMVTIIDPHIKRDNNYYIHSEATAKGLYVKTKERKDYDGWCWPGSSSYLDFTSPEARDWWAKQFLLSNYKGSTLDLFTWNDMNEPSVFNGPEVSMQKDNLNLAGVEHREWHNLYGLYQQMATAQGQIMRSIDVHNNQDKASSWPANLLSFTPFSKSAAVDASAVDGSKKLRSFVLTRSFWAGSQRFGAMWTGDNTANWDHLRIASPMLLSINIAGLSFAGADVGGFFGEPGAELFTRWYQAGAFTPFFRGHAHHDTKRREPWVFGEPYTNINRYIAMLRYSLLPYWYSVFYENYVTGIPAMRALVLEFPDDPEVHAIDDQWLVGSNLLVKPVTHAGVKTVDIYFPRVQDSCQVNDTPLPWYDLETFLPVKADQNNRVNNYPADLEKIPVFIKPGSVLPRKLRLRRSSRTMFYDPYTLFITPGSCNQAEGLVYFDDETTLAHEENGAYAVRKYSYSSNQLRSTPAEPLVQAVAGHKIAPADPNFSVPNTLERIVLLGQKASPKKVVLSSKSMADGQEAVETRVLEFGFDSKVGVVTVKKPDVRMTSDWSISFEY